MASQIFEREGRDGSHFRCSDSFLHGWLHGTLKWSERKATRAAQKVPDNWEELCERAFFRIAYAIKEEDIPPDLYVNLDQTQGVLAQSTNLTWATTGAKQVSVIGLEEKRAMTIVVSIANSGKLLSFQGVYQGFTDLPCPSKNVRSYTDASDIGIHFVYSGSDTYWSNQCTMRLLIDDIIAPYFDQAKEQL
jgi:hypothetical protein